jgi:hypothetical protein
LAGERANLGKGVEWVADPQLATSSMSALSNSSATLSTTMKRLAAMHAWPALMFRDLQPCAAAAAMFASSRTMNGSDPPSSMTEVFALGRRAPLLSVRPVGCPSARRREHGRP